MKYLVIEYKESCNAALYNRNDYETGMVRKFGIECDPFLMAEKYGLSKHAIREEVKREHANHIFELKADLLSAQRDLSRAKAKIYTQETIHSADKEISKWCRPSFHGYRDTVDSSFVSCKRCLKESKLKEIREEKIDYFKRQQIDPITGASEEVRL